MSDNHTLSDVPSSHLKTKMMHAVVSETQRRLLTWTVDTTYAHLWII